MDLHQVVAATFKAVNLRIGQALRQGREFGVLAEEVLAVEAPVFGGKGLHLAVDRVGKRAHQRPRGIPRKQAVPVAAPDEFDHVPAGATKQLFQLVNDAAIAPHRSVQALQIAVDHPHQVVQLFARGQGEGAHAFGLVHFAVTEDAPDLAAGAVQQAAVGEEAHKAGVVNRADGPQTHGAGGELPELGHQPRVRVAGQAARAFARGFEFLAVQRQVLRAQTAFQKRPRIDPGRTVRLKEDQVTQLPVCATPEKMVEADFKQIGRAGVAGNVAAQFAISPVGARHHGQRVPAHQRGQLFLNRQVAGKGLLLVYRHGVDIGRDQFRRPVDLRLVRQRDQLVQYKARPFRAVHADDIGKGIAPFGGFGGVGVGDSLQHGSRDVWLDQASI